MIDYSPLFAYMKEHGYSTYDLLQHGIGNHTLDSLKHNRNITMLTAEKLCRILDCKIENMVTFKENSSS